ncbi:unnamed protein product [Meganyctiphanes norvegica]|uniref:Uncharacterized protein n=1 Tax=Meganyctiphanes norvegica TaxID=48144 RepID=A0AAV2SX69_MEGNR
MTAVIQMIRAAINQNSQNFKRKLIRKNQRRPAETNHLNKLKWSARNLLLHKSPKRNRKTSKQKQKMQRPETLLQSSFVLVNSCQNPKSPKNCKNKVRSKEHYRKI